MAYNPIGHEAAVASAGHAHAIAIDPWILLQRGVDAGHDVLIVHRAPIVDDAAFELVAIPGGTARIAKEDRPTFGGVDLEFVIPIDTVLPGRSAVNAEYHWILLARLPAHRLYEEAVDIPAIGALISKPLHAGE